MATAADILGPTWQAKIPERWTNHYQCLCAERDRLCARDCSAPEGLQPKVDDLTEGASEESERSIALVTSFATQEVLFEVMDAIRRIERDSYGICELTGEPIEPQRLEAIPWARYSLKGQEELEKDGLMRKLALPALQLMGGVSRTAELESDEEEKVD